MADRSDIIALMRRFAPESATEPGFSDNVGLLVGSARGVCGRVLLCLDCTERAVEEAAAKGCSLIVAHHPLIFRSVSRVTDETPTGRAVLAAARLNVSVYCAHTNLDFCDGGLNDFAAETAELKNVRPMTTDGGIKVGRTGDLPAPTTAARLAAKCAEAFGDPRAAVAGDGSKTVRAAAIVNGGGGDIEFLKLAAESGADCYITGDVPHHVALYAAESGMPVIIVQHYATERIYISRLKDILTEAARACGLDAEFIVSESERDPVTTVTEEL